MGFKRTPLTAEQFATLGAGSGWAINDVPREHWAKIPDIERLNQTVAIMASGSMDAAGILNGRQCVAGMDVLVAENRPMANEPEGNAYHYVFQRTNDPRYP